MRRLLLCLFGAALLSACGDTTLQSGASNTPALDPAATVESSAESTAVPDSLAFSAPQVGGGTVDLAVYAGKPVLLWFWAPT